MKKFLPIPVIIVIGLVAFGVFNQKGQEVGSVSPIQNIVNQIIPTPTPFPFQELTIPNLRTRTFESTLGPSTLFNDNPSFTSYVTSFTSEGYKVNGLLAVPKGDAPVGGWPAVVFVHGYIPPTQYRTTGNYLSYISYLANSGILVFKIDLRGHDQSEGEPSGGYYSESYVIDTLSAISALENSDLNISKVGLWGHSMAGNVTFRAHVVKRDIPATVIWAGAGYTYTDISDYSIEDSSFVPPPKDSPQQIKRNLLRSTYGEFDPRSEFWKQVPGTNYLNGVGGAINFHHAKDDNVVSIEYSRNVSGILARSGVENQVFEYQSGGHNLTGASFTEAMRKSVEFYKEKLK